jgi:hypothetical protein
VSNVCSRRTLRPSRASGASVAGGVNGQQSRIQSEPCNTPRRPGPATTLSAIKFPAYRLSVRVRVAAFRWSLRPRAGQLRPVTHCSIHVGNDRSQGGAEIARGRSHGDAISKRDRQASATPANMKNCSNGRWLANRSGAIDPERAYKSARSCHWIRNKRSPVGTVTFENPEGGLRAT